MKGSRQFLCNDHYEEFRREREKERIKIKRKGYDIENKNGKYYERKVTKEKEYNTKLGTSDFGSHLTKDSNGKPDFKKEASFVKKEFNRINKEKTIGDYANKFAGENDESYLQEARERVLDDLAFNEDENGYKQFDSEGKIIDEWEAEQNDEDIVEIEDVDEFFKKPEKKRPKSNKELYKDWKY